MYRVTVAQRRTLPLCLAALAALLTHGCGLPPEDGGTCNAADLEDSLPRDGAVGVPLNATLTAYYGIGATYDGAPITLQAPGVTPVADPTGTFDFGALSITPPGGLVPNTKYTLRWPGLKTPVVATEDTGPAPDPVIGGGATIEFETGSAEDIVCSPDPSVSCASRPKFDGVVAVDWSYSRRFDGCSDAFSERYVFEVFLSEPSDNSPADLLAAKIFQTRGRNLEGPREVAERPYEPDKPIRVELPASDAVGRVCFAALVRDLVGNTSTGLAVERCVDTEHPPFFSGCSVGRRSTGNDEVLTGTLGLIVLSGFWRRRRRFAKT